MSFKLKIDTSIRGHYFWVVCMCLLKAGNIGEREINL